MSVLNVDILDASGARAEAPFRAYLSDLDGNEIGTASSGGSPIGVQVRGTTSTEDYVPVELIPNASIDQDNTYWTIVFTMSDSDVVTRLIEKGAGEETIGAAEVTSPEALGAAATLDTLADVDASAPADGQALVWDEEAGEWVPGALDAPIGAGTVTNEMLAGSIANSKLATNPLARANHTGTQTTATISDFSTATQALIDAAVTALIGGAPGALDTLNELAAAINDDASFAAAVTSALAGKLSLAGGTMSGPIDMDGERIESQLVPACWLTRNAVQAIPSGVWTAVTWQVDFVELAASHGWGFWNVADPTHLVLPEVGTYDAHIAATIEGNCSGIRQLAVAPEGADPDDWSIASEEVSGLARAAGQTLQISDALATQSANAAQILYVYQNSGVSLNLLLGGNAGLATPYITAYLAGVVV